jgi:hypothetical protein
MLLMGFSTGALAYADFRRALKMLSDGDFHVVELSALRLSEWTPLVEALNTLDLSSFRYVSIHLPSLMDSSEERLVVKSLHYLEYTKWPLILHPDTVTDFGLWRELGDRVCIENMDKRKPVGRTERELESIFQQLPDARFCFDIGHACQVDPTMNEAYGILKCYREKLAQIHVSEVNSLSKHDVLSYSTIQSFRDVAHLIPNVPLILETPVLQDQMRREVNKVRFALLPIITGNMVA